MLLDNLWLLLLPLAAASGWFSAARHGKKPRINLPKNYLVGLNFLLNEEPDKAIDTFIKMLEIDSDTIETHLALGNLFRKRGEADRAIRIHQNLTARPNLPKPYLVEALTALALDYLAVGMLDRAEKLFLQLIHLSDQPKLHYQYLLSIYQQEKEWEKAIAIAHKLKKYTHKQMNFIIAHYYCELAEAHLQENMLPFAIKLAKKALAIDKKCVRANLLLSKIYTQNNQPTKAIVCLKQILSQDDELFSEAILPLVQSYRTLHKEEALIKYLKEVLKTHPHIPIVIILSEEICKWRGNKAATTFLKNYIQKYPSIIGIVRLIELILPSIESDTKEDLSMLKQLIEHSFSKKLNYQCSRCGFESKTLYWQCPSCHEWSTVKPTFFTM